MKLSVSCLFEYISKGSPSRLFGWIFPLFLLGSFAYIRQSLENQAEVSKTAIEASLRSELSIGDYAYIARSISDLYRLSFFQCIDVKTESGALTILAINNSPKCTSPLLRWIGYKKTTVLKTLNNNNLVVEFLIFPDLSLVLILLALSLSAAWGAASSYKVYLNKMLLLNLQAEIAKQVAHDIRSPLSALTMIVGTLKEIPEEKRILIRNATQRINDIANDLLQKGKSTARDDSKNEGKNLDGATLQGQPIQLSTEFIPTIIDMLISEKRMQFREYVGLEIDVELKGSFGAFAKVNGGELKRVLSNLVNNSIEAFSNHQGRVDVGVRKIEIEGTSRVEIFVKDNGHGIPKHILAKLGKIGVSHGKVGTQSGIGLGIYHAKKAIESFGGIFQIDSTEGQGTLIKIILPLADAPTWFPSKIDLTAKNILVSLDDDISIHQIWSGRLQSLGITNIEHIKFQSGEAFAKYVNANINKLRQTQFLVDFELLNQSKTGLDIIEDLGIEKYSILVTSRHEEASIQSRAARYKLSILPKSLAGFVPIEMDTPKEHYDWVLLDDDDLVHMTWAMAAKDTQKSFLGFKTPEELNSYKKNLDHAQIIFIDSSLGKGMKGEDLAKQLYAEGFKNIYLATGYPSDQFPQMEFIKGIVGKEPPII